MTRKLGHFADDSIGLLKSLTELPIFEKHLKDFCLATNMLENKNGREILPLGLIATTAENRTRQHPTNNTRPPSLRPKGRKQKNETVIYLGIPHGNVKNFDSFLITKYTKAKAKFASAKSIHQLTISINGTR
eukprot:6174158-Pleurochrysis_carterae.AAC.1